MSTVKIHDYALLIEKVSNGYIVRDISEPGPDMVSEITVIEEDYDRPDGLSEMVSLLRHIKEHFGAHYSKHNSHNIVIEIQATDKEE